MTNTGSVLPWKPEMMKSTGLQATSSAAAVASRRLRHTRSNSKITSVVTMSATLAGSRMKEGKAKPVPHQVVHYDEHPADERRMIVRSGENVPVDRTEAPGERVDLDRPDSAYCRGEALPVVHVIRAERGRCDPQFEYQDNGRNGQHQDPAPANRSRRPGVTGGRVCADCHAGSVRLRPCQQATFSGARESVPGPSFTPRLSRSRIAPRSSHWPNRHCYALGCAGRL